MDTNYIRLISIMNLENIYQTIYKYHEIGENLSNTNLILICVFLGYDYYSQQYIDFVDTHTFEAIFLCPFCVHNSQQLAYTDRVLLISAYMIVNNEHDNMVCLSLLRTWQSTTYMIIWALVITAYMTVNNVHDNIGFGHYCVHDSKKTYMNVHDRVQCAYMMQRTW